MKNKGEEFPDLPSFTEFKGTLYRSYRTRIESKNLYENLGVRDNELPLLHDLLAMGNYGAESELMRVRPWEYQDPQIFPGIALEGLQRFGTAEYRFGRACYYAEEEETAIMEVTYHDRKLQILQDFKNNPGTQLITVDRFMCRLELHSIRAIDLRKLPDEFHEKLTSNDYDFCQRVGDLARETGAEILITPSARRRGGICTPILSDSLLKSATETKVCLFQVQFFRDDSISISRLGDPFTPPPEWSD